MNKNDRVFAFLEADTVFFCSEEKVKEKVSA